MRTTTSALINNASTSGANREVKKAVEAYWANKLSADELTKAAADVKKASWTSLKERGVDLIPRYARLHSEFEDHG